MAFVKVMTIFFAVTLSKAELPGWMDWIIAAYVCFYVVIHMILSVRTRNTFAPLFSFSFPYNERLTVFVSLQISGCMSEKSGSMRINTFPMKDLHNQGRGSTGYEQHKDAPVSHYRFYAEWFRSFRRTDEIGLERNAFFRPFPLVTLRCLFKFFRRGT